MAECVCLEDTPTPDVWLQLLERCRKEATCQATAQRSLAQQLDRQRDGSVHRAVTMLQQRQLLEQQRQLAAQEQHSREQEEQIESLQDELFGQQLLAKEQAYRLVTCRARLVSCRDACRLWSHCCRSCSSSGHICEVDVRQQWCAHKRGCRPAFCGAPLAHSATA